MLSLMPTVQLRTGNMTHGCEGHQLRLKEKIWESEPTIAEERSQTTGESKKHFGNGGNRKTRRQIEKPDKNASQVGEKHFQKEEGSMA